jgi:hypothetical protein
MRFSRPGKAARAARLIAENARLVGDSERELARSQQLRRQMLLGEGSR